jgi:hypothetical protein
VSKTLARTKKASLRLNQNVLKDISHLLLSLLRACLPGGTKPKAPVLRVRRAIHEAGQPAVFVPGFHSLSASLNLGERYRPNLIVSTFCNRESKTTLLVKKIHPPAHSFPYVPFRSVVCAPERTSLDPYAYIQILIYLHTGRTIVRPGINIQT